MGNWAAESTRGEGMKLWTQGTHKSSHMSTDSPSLLRKQAPFFTIALAPSIAFQIGEAYLVASARNQSSLTLYFALRILKQRLSLLDATIQANLANRAKLIPYDFLKPKPLALLGQHSFSQALQAINLPSRWLGFHQNLLAIVSNLSHTLFGILKVDMV